MATTKDYIEYVCERLHGAGGLRYRKMFGEYMVYVNDKPVLLVCDNTVFVKIVPELAALMADAERGLPYEGAKAWPGMRARSAYSFISSPANFFVAALARERARDHSAPPIFESLTC